MKSGKNLTHRSIPEWKEYDLDYNELKKRIREATQKTAPDLEGLRRLFRENLDCLDLFITTKLGELARKLRADVREFAHLKASNESPAVKLECLHSLHNRFINEVSLELRDLNQFILVQQIAVRRIFKEFAKHYPDQDTSRHIIADLNKRLHANRASFLNFDSLALTVSLLDLLLDVEHEVKLLYESLQRKPVIAGPEKVKRTNSASTLGSLRTSLFSDPSPLEDVNFDLDISLTARFDLVTALKKNYSLHCLIPQDVASRNDVSSSMDVYLNIPKVAETLRVSVIFLTADLKDESPSWIVSYADSPNSTMIAYTGGLRKYSYCCLPNSVVNSLLSLLNCKEETDNQQKTRCAAEISTYLQDENLLSMTKLAIASLLQSETAPSLHLVMARTRYLLHKGGKQAGISSANGQNDRLSISPAYTECQSAALSVDDNRVYEDNFYMTLDEQIHTSRHDTLDEISFDVEHMDPFPFNTLSIYSNDSNLHNFEASLSTEIQGNILQNKYRAITLKRLPVKIQNFLQTTAVQLFKDFRIFDYMRSCYFNVIPLEPNNHYSRLLSIDLLKSYENVKAVNNQYDVDGSIIEDKSRAILNRQMSYKYIREEVNTCPNSVTISETVPLLHEQLTSPFCAPKNPYNNVFGDFHIKRLTGLEAYDDEDNENSYLAYLNLGNDLDENFLNTIVLSFIRFKYRARKLFGSPKTFYAKQFESLVRQDYDYYYDSINENATFLDKTNHYQVWLVRDYDCVLSLLYFSLCFSSIFISGINIGILYSVFNMVDEETQFNFLDNFLVIMLLTFGFLFSLAFTMTSINLNFQRFESSPPAHSGVIWTGFVLVIMTIAWSVLCIVP